MSLWRIAWKSIRHRGLASGLTALSMALGVMLVISVLSIHGVISESFRNNSSLGYNMIVGAKGGKLQLTLNTVYYLSQPVENVPYEYFLEFQDQAYRDQALQHSLKYKAHQAQWDAVAAQAAASREFGGLGAQLFDGLIVDQLREVDLRTRLDMQRGGQFKPFTAFAIPLCLGDYFDRFRVIGTTPAMFDDLVWDLDRNLKFEFAQGRNFRHYTEENGYFEAVLGAVVAREMDIQLGQKISPAHGADGHTHENEFTVVGILKPSGTPHDRGVFINMEGFYLMGDHAKPLPKEELDEDQTDSPPAEAVEDAPPNQAMAESLPTDPLPTEPLPTEPLPTEQREVTAMLVRTANPFMTPRFQNTINEGRDAQAVLPVQEIYNLFDFLVRPIQYALLVLTSLICVVSGVSILVSIYNSMSDRRHEIAVMRALGASRTTVMTIILLESIFLSLGGGLLGWTMGHVLNAAASSKIEERTGISLGFFDVAPPVNVLGLLGTDSSIIKKLEISPELLLIPFLMFLAVVVGFVPALSAYRTDVSKSLGK